MSIQSDHSVYLALKDAISYNRIGQNTYINVNEIAAEHGVSPVPVREALIRLSAEDLIEYFPSRGFHVRPLELPEVQESYFVMYMLVDRTLHQLKRPIEPVIRENVILLTEQVQGLSMKEFDDVRLFENMLERLARMLMCQPSLSIFLNLIAKTRSFRTLIYTHCDREGVIIGEVKSVFDFLRSGDIDGARQKNKRLMKMRASQLCTEYAFYVSFLKTVGCTGRVSQIL
jgi:DNA-binding GntR family transcriptional regulator